MAFDIIQKQLQQLEQQQLLRRHWPIDGSPGRTIQINNSEFVNFSSNDYLGLSQEPSVKAAFVAGIERYGCGSTASAVVTGYSTAHQELVELVCDWTGREAGLLFNSGFAANSAVIAALVQKGDFLLLDKLSHASLIDAALSSEADFSRFAHNDLTHLEQKLTQSDAENKLVVTEGVFSMDGDQGRLSEIQRICERNNSWLFVDDAHGIGQLGATGAGTLQLQQVSPQIHMATFGKALGVAGAVVTGTKEFIDYLTQKARHHIYSTAMPAAQAMAVTQAIKVAQQQEWRRDKLQQLITHFRAGANSLGLNLLDSNTAIQPIILGDVDKTLSVAEELKSQGIWLTAIRPPTVPRGTSRLRVTLSAAHELKDVDQLLSRLEVVCG